MVNVRWSTVFAVITIFSAAFMTQPSTVNASPSDEDWPMFQHDPAHTGTTNSSAPKTAPTILWSLESKGNEISVSPAIADGIIYASTRDLYAYNASTGKILWRVTHGGETSPIFAKGIVYTGTAHGTAYNASTGTVIWSISNNDTYTNAIAYYSGIFYVTTEDSTQALNATTGKIIWTSTSEAYFVTSAISEGIIYCIGGIGSTIIKAVNAYNGSLIWQTTVSKRELSSNPAVSFGHVYVGCNDDNLYCLDAYTGEKLWNYSTGGMVRSSPAIAYGYVYFGSLDGKVYALNAATGQIIWTFKTEEVEGYGVESSPTVADGVVYIGAGDGKVYALDAHTGTEVWSLKVGSVYDPVKRGLYGFISAPAIAYGNIYIMSTGHFIMAIEPSQPELNSALDIAVVAGVVLAVVVPLLCYLIWSRREKRLHYAEA